MQIQFSDLPERGSQARQWHKVIAPRGTHPLTVLLLGERILGVLTHYLDDGKGRTVPCEGADCRLCLAGLSRRWKGYCACVDLIAREFAVVEISEGAARSIEANPWAKHGLRGLELRLQRLKTHRNAPVYATLCRHGSGSPIPAAFDPVPHLMRLWDSWGVGKERRAAQLAQENPNITGDYPPHFPEDDSDGVASRPEENPPSGGGFAAATAAVDCGGAGEGQALPAMSPLRSPATGEELAAFREKVRGLRT